MAATSASVWLQKQITLRQKPRGCHLVTSEVVDAVRNELAQVNIGICHVFIMHTSAVSCIHAVPKDHNDLI